MDFKGQKVIVPSVLMMLLWWVICGVRCTKRFEDCAQAICQLAEGQPVRTGGRFQRLALAGLPAGRRCDFLAACRSFSALFSSLVKIKQSSVNIKRSSG